MNIHELENQLKNQQYTFSASFSREVLAVLQLEKTPIFLQPRWLLMSVAASIVFCMVSVYVQDGSLSLDAILGVAEYSEMTDYYGYIQL